MTMTMTMMMKLLFVLMTTMIWGLLPSVHAEIDAMTGLECVDNHDQCGFWAATGECTKNPKYMGEYCRLSCDKCRVVRLGSANDINAFLASKKGEIEAKRKEFEAKQAQKAKEAEVLNALQGSEDEDTDDTKKKDDDGDGNKDTKDEL